MSQDMNRTNPRETSESSSTFWLVAQDFLYLLPPGSGELLIRSFSAQQDMQRSIEWFKRVLNYDASALLSWILAEGDEEDHRIYANVFLWKQRHKMIDSALRVNGKFEDSPYTYHLHRYMLANGDEGVLDIPRSSYDAVDRQSPNFSYRAEAGQLLDRFSAEGLSTESEDFERLTDLLSILGPQFDSYPRRPEVAAFAANILAFSAKISGIPVLTSDPGFTNFSWLMLDLGLDPAQTWEPYKALALAKRKRSVSSYPALISGLSMYPDKMSEILGAIEVQGGRDLFLTLVSG